jgi:hypothetical protein
MAADPAFSAQVEALRGKALLCGCSGKENGHYRARVLLELSHRQPGPWVSIEFSRLSRNPVLGMER